MATRELQHDEDGALGHLGPAAAVAAVVAWGTGPVIAKHVAVEGLVLGWYRLSLGAVAAGLVLVATGRRLTRADLRTAVPGGIAFGLDMVLFFTAVKHTTVANATIISALQPALMLLVVGPLFGERVARRSVVLTAVALAGVIAVVLASSGTTEWSPGGDALAVAALVAWMGYFVAAKQARRTVGVLSYLVAIQLIGAAFVTPLALLSGRHFAVASGDWAWIAVMVAVPGGAGHLLMNWAHRYTAMQLSSALTLGMPVVSTLAAAVFLDEPLLVGQVVGMAVVVAALGALVWRASEPGAARATQRARIR